MDTIDVEWPAPGVCRIVFGDPAARNALDRATLADLAAAIDGAAPRCLVLAGRGPCFSAGYDLKAVARAADPVAEAERLVAHPATPAVAALTRARCPTIAQIAGHAIGGGLELAVACDLRVAATTARLQMPPAPLGLTYSHTGIARFLELVGVARTRELFLTARTVDGATAQAWGLVTDSVEADVLEAHTLALAARIAAYPAAALAATKRVLRALAPQEPASAASSELERLRCASLASPEFGAAVTAFAARSRETDLTD